MGRVLCRGGGGDLYPDTHMMHDVNEFFAVFSTGYFEVTDELGQGSDRETLKASSQKSFGPERNLWWGHSTGGIPDEAGAVTVTHGCGSITLGPHV